MLGRQQPRPGEADAEAGKSQPGEATPAGPGAEPPGWPPCPRGRVSRPQRSPPPPGSLPGGTCLLSTSSHTGPTVLFIRPSQNNDPTGLRLSSSALHPGALLLPLGGCTGPFVTLLPSSGCPGPAAASARGSPPGGQHTPGRAPPRLLLALLGGSSHQQVSGPSTGWGARNLREPGTQKAEYTAPGPGAGCAGPVVARTRTPLERTSSQKQAWGLCRALPPPDCGCGRPRLRARLCSPRGERGSGCHTPSSGLWQGHPVRPPRNLSPTRGPARLRPPTS